MSDKPSEFTCICCRVAFKDGEIQRMHYKTDWHRYNLKRKVAELPPVTSEEFQRRVITQKANDAQQAEDHSQYCKCCRKSFSNAKAYDNHLNSKKHKDNEVNFVESDVQTLDNSFEKKAETENKSVKTDAMSVQSCESYSEVEEIDSDEWDDAEVSETNCLFCGHHSRTLLKNLHHMSVSHTFFIPDVEYCTDLQGLIQYLAQKVEQGFMCLWCNDKGRTFHSADAAKSHMLDKGHCKMLHEGLTLAEYADFYDYSTSYPDADNENVDADEEVEMPELDGTEYQLVLPSGAVIGHRSLMRYYKQSIDPNRAVVVHKSANKLHKVLATYRALGWSPAQQEASARRARDLHSMKRLYTKYNMKMGMIGNKILQKHFRQQVNY